MFVKEVMATSPICCTESSTVQMAIALMKDHEVGLLPVVTDLGRELVGVVTDRDLCVRVLAEGHDASKVKINRCMTHNPVCCRHDDQVDRAIALMKDHRLRRILVVNGRNEVEGLVSLGDLLRCHVDAEELGGALSKIFEPEVVASG